MAVYNIEFLNNINVHYFDVVYRLLLVHLDVLDLMHHIHALVAAGENRMLVVPSLRQRLSTWLLPESICRHDRLTAMASSRS